MPNSDSCKGVDMIDKGTGIDMRDKIIVFFVITLLFICFASIVAHAQIDDRDRIDIYFFYDPMCGVCSKEKPFLHELEGKYPRLRVNYIIYSDNRTLFLEMCERYNTTPARVPRTFIGDMAFVGFDEQECDLIWYDALLAHIGCSNQIENSIRELVNLSKVISKSDAIEISRKNCLVCNLTSSCGDLMSDAALVGDTYLVAWWTPERIKSDLDYPNVLVRVDAKTGEVISAVVPVSTVYGIEKPHLSELNYTLISLLAFILLLPVAYMFFGNRLQRRYWLSIFSLLIIIFLFIYFGSIPSMNVVEYARQFSFPVFTFIIALADGFNPCAFAVLAFLLSILTHTKSRKKMLFIGSIFILTSGFVYFLLIIVASTLYNLLSAYTNMIQTALALLAITVGLINLKDFFFFKKGISLTMSAEKQGNIFRKIGDLVRRVEQASSKRDIVFAAAATIILAAMVNVVELGCTAILPTQYILVLESNYAREDVMYTAFIALYSVIYIIPLFAMLGSFIYSFKSERLTEMQGRILKLVGGLLMICLGIILIFKPELLIFGG